MRFTKILLTAALILGSVLLLFTNVAAQSDSESPGVVIVLFWSQSCSHCAQEKPFLEELAQQYPQVRLEFYEVSQNSENLGYMYDMGEAMDFEVSGVPVTIIGEQVWVGYSESVSEEIEDAVISCLTFGCSDPMVKIGVNNDEITETDDTDDTDNIDKVNNAVNTDITDNVEKVEESSSVSSWLIPAVVIVVFAIGLSICFGSRKDRGIKR